mmetsp:Transcript_6777/g.14823  ORF Transcript_6777/g.14823 Transcript_6777/m.14823 type:complete len:174 (-) Transcript_6777:908-1429(-)
MSSPRNKLSSTFSKSITAGSTEAVACFGAAGGGAGAGAGNFETLSCLGDAAASFVPPFVAPPFVAAPFAAAPLVFAADCTLVRFEATGAAVGAGAAGAAGDAAGVVAADADAAAAGVAAAADAAAILTPGLAKGSSGTNSIFRGSRSSSSMDLRGTLLSTSPSSYSMQALPSA